MRKEYKVLAICLVTFTVFSGAMSMLAYATPTTRFATPINGTRQSINWAGYAVYGSSGSITQVRGEWVVPSVSGNNWFASFYAACWVGIDGYVAGSGTVEQIGTCSSVGWFGITSYFAWYEMYPAAMVKISMAIHPGDYMQAIIYYNAAQNNFLLAITDMTTKAYYDTYQTATNAQRSSAEWIVEAPFVNWAIAPLANFRTVTFQSCHATVNGYQDLPIGFAPIAGAQYDAITMVTDDGTIKASPSGLSSGGTSFTVTWYHY